MAVPGRSLPRKTIARNVSSQTSLVWFSVRRSPVPLCRGLTQTVICYRSVPCSRRVSFLPFLSYDYLHTPGTANSSGQSAWLPGTAIVGSLGSGATGIADLCLAREIRGCNEGLRSRQPFSHSDKNYAKRRCRSANNRRGTPFSCDAVVGPQGKRQYGAISNHTKSSRRTQRAH